MIAAASERGFDRCYSYLMNMLVEMQDALSLMWQTVYLEQGGPQAPLAEPKW